MFELLIDESEQIASVLPLYLGSVIVLRPFTLGYVVNLILLLLHIYSLILLFQSCPIFPLLVVVIVELYLSPRRQSALFFEGNILVATVEVYF